uniref:CAAX prenyl protease 2 n=2 Tax=Ixodes ricinus TaxID=34613 RepID=V5H061_IXORI
MSQAADLSGGSCCKPILWAFMLALTYVGSLYIWRTKEHRDHPSTIKKRFVSVFAIICISPLFVVFGADLAYFKKDMTIPALLGLRLEGLAQAVLLPLALTMVLFTGPLVLHYFDGIWSLYIGKSSSSTVCKPSACPSCHDPCLAEPRYWYSNLKNLIWLRNHIVAPLSEEFTFRACMLPLLVPCLGQRAAILICPLFFGVAHFHHLTEKLARTSSVKLAVMRSVFQFGYTTIFGAYSVYLFLRTGHFVAPFVAHAFCNHMGFPDMSEVFGYKQPRLSLLLLAFLGGLVAWASLLEPLTQPDIYHNSLYAS